MESTESSSLISEDENQQEEEGIEVQSRPITDYRGMCNSYKWKVFGNLVNSLVHTLIGASVFVTLWFAFKSTPIGPFQLHIALCVTGYQLLMSHAILSLSSSNGWSSHLTFLHRRRVHWILQLAGSTLAIIGSSIMMKHKSVNFTSTHGRLALAALIFTCLSLINGVTSLYAAELRRFVLPRVSKISHIILGTAAFALSTVCLAFGYNKNSFKEWASEEIAYVMTGVISTYTFIIIVTPCFSSWRLIYEYFKNKIC